MRARLVVLGLVLAGAVLATILGGFGGLGVYVFFVLLVGALVWGLGAGGGWLQDASRRRFDDDGR